MYCTEVDTTSNDSFVRSRVKGDAYTTVHRKKFPGESAADPKTEVLPMVDNQR